MSTFTFRGMTIPEHMLAGLQRYIQRRIKPGDFLTAVIKNDLRRACECADSDNIHLIPAYVAYLYNEAPGGCWGSEANMVAWLNPPAPVARLKDGSLPPTQSMF